MTTAPDNNDTLMTGFIIAMIAPLLMAGGMTDIGLATAAARQAIDAYRPRGEPDLLCAAQIMAFTVTSLDSLRLSADPAASVNQKLRLRGNANGLGRSCQRANTMLAQQRRDPAYDPPENAGPDPMLNAGPDPMLNSGPDPNEARRQAELIHALAETTGLIARAQANVDAEKAQAEPAAEPPPPETVPAETVPPETVAAGTVAAGTIPSGAVPAGTAHRINDGPASASQAATPASQAATPASQPASQPASPTPATTPRHASPGPHTEPDDRLRWAAAMTQVAREFSDRLPGLPQSERRIEMLRIQALNTVARKLTGHRKRPPINAGLTTRR